MNNRVSRIRKAPAESTRTPVPIRARLGRASLFLAAMGPYFVTTSSGGFGQVNEIQVAVSVLGIGVGVFLAQPRRRLALGLAEWALITFVFIALLSATWSALPAATFLKAAGLALSYLAIRLLVARYSTWQQAIAGLATCAQVTIFAAFVGYLVAPGLAFSANSVAGGRRLISLVPTIGANPLALLCVVGLASVLLGVPSRARMGARWGMGALFVVVLVMTGTRSAWAVGGLLLAAGLVVVARRSASWTALAALSIPFLLLAIAARWEWIMEAAERGQDAQALSSLTGRTPAWREAMALWAEHPFFGGGYYVAHRFEVLGGSRTNIDQTWLEAMVDVGIVGALALATFTVAGLLRSARQLRSARPIEKEGLLAIAILISVIAVSFINPTVQSTNFNQLLLGFVILASAPGITPSAVVSSIRRHDTRSFHPSDHVWARSVSKESGLKLGGHHSTRARSPHPRSLPAVRRAREGSDL